MQVRDMINCGILGLGLESLEKQDLIDLGLERPKRPHRSGI